MNVNTPREIPQQLGDTSEQHPWILVETLGPQPLVVAVGDRPKRLPPLQSMLRRNPNAQQILTALADLRTLGEQTQVFDLRGGKSLHVHPVVMPDGAPHGAQCWIGGQGCPAPARSLGGGWLWDLSSYEAVSNDDSLRAVGATSSTWKPRRSIAEDLLFFEPAPDELEAIVAMMNAPAGHAFTSTWATRSEHGRLRHLQFAGRLVDEVDSAGTTRRLVRGVSTDVAPPLTTSPPNSTIAQQVTIAEREPGEHRVLAHPRSLAIFRWWDDPLPGMAWRYDADIKPGVHPEDIARAKAMRAALPHSTTVEVLRVRAEDGGWIAVRAAARLVSLGSVGIALVSLRLAEQTSVSSPALPAQQAPAAETAQQAPAAGPHPLSRPAQQSWSP